VVIYNVVFVSGSVYLKIRVMEQFLVKGCLIKLKPAVCCGIHGKIDILSYVNLPLQRVHVAKNQNRQLTLCRY